jgi:peptidylamidoglycolate lyase
MHGRAQLYLVAMAGVAVLAAGCGSTAVVDEGESAPTSAFAAVAGEVGGQDVFGPYGVVAGWPKNISTVSGNEQWTWGAGQSVFAESPDRVLLLHRGQLPNIERPEARVYPEAGPALSFPVAQLPWRNASVGPRSALPGALDGGDKDRGTPGVDHLWQNILVVANRNGDIIERWTQWDDTFRRPHAVFISPYDAEKHVWVVDDYRHAIFKFTNDGKELVMTLGEPNVAGDDDRHFSRPTFIAWLPDGSMFVADGYTNTRVVKFDADGNYVTAWGQPGNPPNDTRPGYFNNVHGIATDPETNQVFVNDRGNRRIQVFDQDGQYLRAWSIGAPPVPDIHLIYIGADRVLWAADRGTSKVIGYDLDGRLLYTWGTFGDFPGGMWGVHGMSVDQEGNFYVAEVGNGRVQKYTPREGARPELLVGRPVYAAWQ